MALNFKPIDTFAATVNVELPSDNPSKPNKGSFVARFKYLDRTQMDTLRQQLQDGQLTDETFLDTYLVGLSGIGDESGTAMPEAEQRRIVYSVPALTLATVKAFFDSITGAGRKN